MGIANSLTTIMNNSTNELSLFGQKAASFAMEKKNYINMTSSILFFLQSLLSEGN